MDWLKWFALVVAVATVQAAAETPKKKIRIHLPQKVKHIHHHKKIYITNHPASPQYAASQYAPAFMPSAEGAVAMPTNVAVPAVANMLPLSSMELYDEAPARMPGFSAAASKLLPLYRARGYYGPSPQEYDDQDYDLAPPPEPAEDSYMPAAFSSPVVATIPPNYPPKRVTILNLNEPPRKKVPRKGKPKRAPVRSKPQLEEEHPVTSFHEQFYSDVDGSGTIRKVRKPQRVEKIIDGDTEHIHTYSEEHIHKLVFDDGTTKISGVLGIDPMSSMSALAAQHHPLVPYKNPPLIAIPSDPLTGFTAIGSMGTPSNLEYAAYNPREVTHDHIFHDHGEIPPGVDPLALPPRLTYNNRGLPIGLASTKGRKTKYGHKYKNHIKANDLYENMFNHFSRLRGRKPTPYDATPEDSLDDYRPLPSFKLKDKPNSKARNVVPALYFGNGKQVSDYRLPQADVQGPHVSTTVVHEYKPKNYLGAANGIGKYNKGLYGFNNNDALQTYASSSNYYGPDSSLPNYPVKKGKKKSVSTQNVSFGGLDHQTMVDHLESSGSASSSLETVIPSAVDHYAGYDQQKTLEAAHPTAFTIKESSPVHPYYTAMAMKALQNEQQSYAEASNDNFQYVDAPTKASPDAPPSSVEPSPVEEYFESQPQSAETTTPEPTEYDTKPRGASKEKTPSSNKEHRPRYKIIALQSKEPTYEPELKHYRGKQYSVDASSILGKLKYGDKI